MVFVGICWLVLWKWCRIRIVGFIVSRCEISIVLFRVKVVVMCSQENGNSSSFRLIRVNSRVLRILLISFQNLFMQCWVLFDIVQWCLWLLMISLVIIIVIGVDMCRCVVSVVLLMIRVRVSMIFIWYWLMLCIIMNMLQLSIVLKIMLLMVFWMKRIVVVLIVGVLLSWRMLRMMVNIIIVVLLLNSDLLMMVVVSGFGVLVDLRMLSMVMGLVGEISVLNSRQQMKFICQLNSGKVQQVRLLMMKVVISILVVVSRLIGYLQLCRLERLMCSVLVNSSVGRNQVISILEKLMWWMIFCIFISRIGQFSFDSFWMISENISVVVIMLMVGGRWMKWQFMQVSKVVKVMNVVMRLSMMWGIFLVEGKIFILKG